MKLKMLVMALVLFSATLHAKKNCTDQPKSKWMSIEAFKEFAIKQGYVIDKFKEPGSCYEIYGKNRAGQSVEVYFNPVDGSVVKSEIDD
jgi:hypothetical protein